MLGFLAGGSPRAGLASAGSGLAWVWLASLRIWLDLAWFLLDFTSGFIYYDFLISAGSRLDLAWLLHFRLLLQRFLFILASHRLSWLSMRS